MARAPQTPELQAIDAAIGARIHELRLTMGMSRVQLSEKIGVTHQQLQKYEKGLNRISAGRLVAIARALGKHPSYFFDDVDSDSETFVPGKHQNMCIVMARNFMRITNPDHRVAVNALVASLVGESAVIDEDGAA